MAAVQAVPPPKKIVLGRNMLSLLQFCTQPATYNPVRVAVIMDTYGERRIRREEVSQVANVNLYH